VSWCPPAAYSPIPGSLLTADSYSSLFIIIVDISTESKRTTGLELWVDEVYSDLRNDFGW